MKRLTILLFAICYLSCKSSHAQQKPSAEAIALNNMAFALGNDSLRSNPSDSVHLLQEAINILNKSLKIDSNYYIAYRNKMNFQAELKQQDSAFFTAKQIIKKWPKQTQITILAGEYCEFKGDTTSAVGYYKKALSVINHVLDSIGVNSKRYGSRQIEKAKVLMLLDQPEKAHNILKDLFDHATSEFDKQNLKDLMGMNRHDVLYGKTATINNTTTIINW